MSKKCPPGVICLENMTLIFLVIIIGVVFYYVVNSASNQDKHNIIIKQQQVSPSTDIGMNSGLGLGLGYFTRPNYAYNNLPGDILMNPYVPPLSDERYLVPNITVVPPGRIPINISTNGGAVDTNYRQMGLLTPLNGSQKILPLMGRPLFTNRNKWQYYTMSDQNNSVKLPILKNGRNCMNEYGCDELYNGDNVIVQGYNERFKITIYEKDTIKYIPYI
jgi:hypothetical protein